MRKAINLLVLKNKEILLVRKGKVWILPGGKPERDESDLECLCREVKEEVGVDSVVENFYNSFTGKTPHKGDLLQAEVYFGWLKYDKQLFQREGDSIKEAKFVKQPLNYPLSEITRKIIGSLVKDGYLK